jgi:hypothetical protein
VVDHPRWLGNAHDSTHHTQWVLGQMELAKVAPASAVVYLIVTLAACIVAAVLLVPRALWVSFGYAWHVFIFLTALKWCLINLVLASLDAYAGLHFARRWHVGASLGKLEVLAIKVKYISTQLTSAPLAGNYLYHAFG